MCDLLLLTPLQQLSNPPLSITPYLLVHLRHLNLMLNMSDLTGCMICVEKLNALSDFGKQWFQGW